LLPYRAVLGRLENKSMAFRMVALTAVFAAALVPAARGSAPQTTVPDVFLTVHVTLTDSRISLDRRSAARGDEVRFIMRNAGTKLHNFTLGGTAVRGTGRQTGFSSTLKPKQEKFVLLFMDYRGPIPYRSKLSQDVRKPGMRGVFTVR
jgi:hypothetical protein